MKSKKDVRTINEHIKKIYSDSELEEASTVRDFRIVQTEGSRQVTRDIKHYNLQMILPDKDFVDFLNVKSDPMLIASLRGQTCKRTGRLVE